MRLRVVYHFAARRLQWGRKLLSERRTRDGFRLVDASAAMPAGSDGRKTRQSLRRPRSPRVNPHLACRFATIDSS
jgi:hypothetical protein